MTDKQEITVESVIDALIQRVRKETWRDDDVRTAALAGMHLVRSDLLKAGLLDNTTSTHTEIGEVSTTGFVHVWPTDDITEAIYPLERRIAYAKQHRRSVYKRTIVVVQDWEAI